MRGYYYGHMLGGAFGGWTFIITAAVHLALLVGFVLLVIWVVKNLSAGRAFNRVSDKEKSSNGALDIINQRYAKGEIDEEQYLKMRETLTRK